MFPIRLLSVVLLMLPVLMSGCGAGDVPKQDSPSGDASPSPAATAEIRLVASGDTHGWIIPCGCTSNQSGGLLRRATFIDQQRSTHPQLIVVDVGGAADGTAACQLARFRAILLGERLMRTAAHNLGAAEIAFGRSTLDQLQQETDVPFISANTRDPLGNRLARPFVLVETNGGRILITGVASPSMETPDVRISEPTNAILEVTDDVGDRFDRLVVLAYLSVDELRKLAETLPEADVIIGGPTGQSLFPEQIGRVLLTSATNKGKFLADISLPAKRSAPVTARIAEMTPEFADHAQQVENLQEFRRHLAQRDFTAKESGLLGDDRFWSGAGAEHRVAGTEACGACHADINLHWQTTGHAHAWDRLVREGAHVDPHCQQCHTTGYGRTDGFQSLRSSGNRTAVGCESCHGPSDAHVRNPSEQTPFEAREACLKCHDAENSPTFEMSTWWEKIRHG